MRKLLPALVAVAMLLMLAPTVGPWKWRTHGGVYGTRGIAEVAYERIIQKCPQYVRDNLDWDTIMVGAIAPDKWRVEPYFMDEAHVMTYTENQGGDWLDNASKLRDIWGTQNVSDNLSYYLGIAAHYWGDVTQYMHHDNARSYFENLYGEEVGYQIWDAHHDHIEWQVEYYRPKDPALIVQNDGTAYGSLALFLAAARNEINTFIANVIEPGNTDNMDRWFWVWIDSHKCEASDYSVYHDGNVDNVHYGSKELVDMATELVYSGWVYALDIQNSVGGDRTTWAKWWSRQHRTPGLLYY